MSEELLQRGLDKNNPTTKIGKWDYYDIGATTLKALKGANIIRNIDYGNLENKKVDALIVNKKDVIAIVEFKQPKEFKTDAQKQKAINQEIDVAHKLGAKIIIATDTKDTLWVNALTGKKITDESGNVLTAQFSITDERLPALIEKINYSINEKNNQILPKKLVNPTDLARSIWQDIWSVSGATPENCLYTFVELFIFKYLSDLGILKSTNSFDFVMSMYTSGDTADEALQYYADNIRKKIKELFPYNHADNTTIINGTIFVSKDQKAVAGYSTVFKKVLQKFNDYGRLEHIDYDFKSQLFESFLKESISKKNWGQFFTPMKVIRAIEKISKDEIKEGAVICDPACGVGKFLLEPIKSRLDRFYSVEGDKVIPKITIRGFDKGFDKDEQKTIILAKANMLIYFSEIIKDHPSHTKEFAKIFNDSFTLKTNSILGTLKDPIENEYDLILTNPPYVTSGSSNLKEEIQKDSDLKSYYKVNAIGVEGLFMEWIVRALKPNGKAFIIVPDGIFNRQNDKNLRAFLRQECFIDGIISLPLNTFFTTNKKTYILCLTKKNTKADIQTSPVFTYLVSEIGESRDVYRFDIEQNDLEEAATLYGFFKGNKSSFETINKDPRCKIVPVDKFDPDTHWSVDRWWSKEEKIGLGIEEEDKTIKFEELPYFVEDIADNIMGIKNLLLELSEKKKPNLEFKDVLIGDIFTAQKGLSKYTKTYGQSHKGEYPVYSGSNIAPIIFIDTYDYDGKYLSWVVDGFAGYMKVLNGKYSATGHRGILTIKSNFIDIDYVKFMLEPTLRELAKGRKGDKGSNEYTNVSSSVVENSIISIPILPNGDFDLDAQQAAVERYRVVSDLKTKAKEYEQALKGLTITVEKDLSQCNTVLISEIFTIQKGLSKYTKTYGQSHKGEYPVYSASNNAPLTYINSFDYDGEFLTWATNGFAGYIKVLDEKFSINGDRGLLIRKNDRIDIEYVQFVLEPILRELAKGRKGDKGGDEFTKVYPSMVENATIFIPVLPDGSYDIMTQRAIAEKYKKIKEIENLLLLELKKIGDFLWS